MYVRTYCVPNITCYTNDMDIETQKIIDEVAQKAATDAVVKMREFHQDDLKVLRERMDIGFEQVDRRFDEVDKRLNQVEQRLD